MGTLFTLTCGVNLTLCFSRPRVAAIQAARSSGIMKRATKNVAVYFHAITKGICKLMRRTVFTLKSYELMQPPAPSDGLLSAATIESQIKALNDQYASFGYSFTLIATTTTLNPDWFSAAGPGTSQQTAMKASLRQGGAAALNFYSVGFETGSGKGLLGYATFP